MSRVKASVGLVWTDEEYGFVLDKLDWPVARVAEALGRTGSSVQNVRSKLKRGWSPKQEANRAWPEEDINYILNNPQMSAPDIAKRLRRTTHAVNQQRLHLRRTREGVPSFLGNFSPFIPGARPLLAQTCPECGLLLQEKWFQTDKLGRRCRTCKRCRAADRKSRGIFPSRSTKTDQHMAAQKARYNHWQNVTVERAENRGQPWTEADLKVLADPDMTIFQKAITLKRTWFGVQVAAVKRGFHHKRGLGDPERDQWLIDNPNADRVDEIRAQFESMTDDLEIPQPELETAGAPKRPVFDWDD